MFSRLLKRNTHALQTWFGKRFSAWLVKRVPSAHFQKIHQGNIFIFPTKFGFSYLLLVALLFVLGTNYQNNIILLLCYLLISFFISCLLHSFFNLSGLAFRASMPLQGFVGGCLYYPITIISTRQRFNLSLSFAATDVQALKQHEKTHYVKFINQLVIGDSHIQLPFMVQKRGVYPLGRILIESYYGFGLFRTWTRLDFADQIIAYPQPLAFVWQKTPSLLATESTLLAESNGTSYLQGSDEFFQLQPYQSGEPLSRVAWKQLARGQGWLTKQYHSQAVSELTLDYQQMPATSVEQRLSQLSYAIKQCQQQQLAFALKLPGQYFAKANSSEHMQSCLAALASFDGAIAMRGSNRSAKVSDE